MACCGNCAQGHGPCLDSSKALALAPRPTLARRNPRQLGKLSDPVAAGVSVSQGVGAVGGGWGGWALAALAFGKKNTAAKVIAAAAGAYLGYQVVPAVTDASGI